MDYVTAGPYISRPSSAPRIGHSPRRLTNAPISVSDPRVRRALLGPVAVAGTPPLQPPRDIRRYVLFAYDELILKGAVGVIDRGYVHGGDIGVNYPDRGQDGSPSLSYATLGPVVMDAGSNAVADSVRAANAEGVFYNLFANSVNANFSATILGAGPLPYTTPIIAPENLPVFPFTPGRALTDGAADVLVGNTGLPSPHTLDPARIATSGSTTARR